jgi:hypothetical protein
VESASTVEQGSDGVDAAHAGDSASLRRLKPFDVEQNIAAGTRYVTALMWEFHGDLRLVVAAYSSWPFLTNDPS